MTDDSKDQKPSKFTAGGRNLFLLGVGAVLITFLTTFISLKVYHDSGDIYLDRSRPGFLPEKEEAENDKEPGDYKLPDSGQITDELLDEYLDHLKQEIDRLNDFSDEPFDSAPLADDMLGF